MYILFTYHSNPNKDIDRRNLSQVIDQLYMSIKTYTFKHCDIP